MINFLKTLTAKLLFLGCIFFINTQAETKEKKSLKILFAVGVFPKLTETFIVNQMTGMIDRGHSIEILSMSGEAETDIIQDNVIAYNLLEKTSYSFDSKKLHDFDVILCQFGPIGKDFANVRIRHNFKAKLVTFFRGKDLTENPKNKSRIYKNLFRHGDLFLPVCESFKKKLLSIWCPADKIKVLHSAISLKDFTFAPKHISSEKEIICLSVCRLVEKKGIEYSINAIVKAHEENSNIKFIIAGEGPLRPKLEELISSLNAQSYVTLVGHKSTQDIAKLLNQAHIFLQPSVTAESGDQEGIPNAIKEAFASGLPVITTHHSGIEELVENQKSGFVLSEKDSNAIAEKILYLINNPAIYYEMAQQGYQKVVNEFEMEKENDKLESLLLDLVKHS